MTIKNNKSKGKNLPLIQRNSTPRQFYRELHQTLRRLVISELCTLFHRKNKEKKGNIPQLILWCL